MRRVLDFLLVTAFLLAIGTPLAANFAGMDGADAEAENRALAQFPPLDRSWVSISGLLPGLAAWFSDHFGFRAWLVQWYGETRYFWLHVSPSSSVVRGKQGWLYYADDFGIEDYSNETPMPPRGVANWRAMMLRTRDWCQSHGIAYVFAIIPDKHTIYPEFFNDTVRQVSSESWTDQVLAATLDTGVVVDVRPAIFARKPFERLYHMTDTHWNQRGAFPAYQEIIRGVRKQDPDVPPPWERSDFEPVSRDIPGLDLAAMIGLKRVLHEEELRFTLKRKRNYVVVEPRGGYATAGEGRIVTEIPGSSLPRAVIFRDSFTSWLAPFFSEHFSRAVYLWQDDFDPDVVLQEDADVVIQELVGRHLHMFIPTPALVRDP